MDNYEYKNKIVHQAVSDSTVNLSVQIVCLSRGNQGVEFDAAGH